MYEIMEYDYALENDYAFAVCYCTALTEGIAIPRTKEDRFVKFECPRCGERLGMFVKSLTEK